MEAFSESNQRGGHDDIPYATDARSFSRFPSKEQYHRRMTSQTSGLGLDAMRHVPPASWLGELIGCGCGHGIGRHGLRGCNGRTHGECPCTKNPSDVLDAEIRAVKKSLALDPYD
jgi:hypothetical protein